MRVGHNPQKDTKTQLKKHLHRIIIPVYIPNLNGYYNDSLNVLKMCLESVTKTKSINTVITIVNNDSCVEVINYLNDLYLSSKIDDLIHTQKIGKLNSILKALKSSSEDFVTISDADVLFLPNWLSATFEVFNNFSKAGVVGIVPQIKSYENLGYNVIFDCILTKRVKFTKLKNPDALYEFYKSVGREHDYNKDYLKYNLSVRSTVNKTTNALIGSGHFVATYKRSLFDDDLEFTEYLLGGNSEFEYLDLPCVKKGLWRLTTNNNYAYHIGNHKEVWMEELLKDIEDNNIILAENITTKPLKNKTVHFLFSQKLMRLLVKYNKNFFYKKWGLPKQIAENY